MMVQEQIKKELKPAQQASLELAKIVDGICRKYGIKYTLLWEALWGATEYNGFVPWSATISIGFLYFDFLKFIDIFKQEFDGREYYVLDDTNCEQFEELYVRICKRSRVKLPEHRKKDEKYYDYFINIIPIFYAGDTKREQKKLLKEFKYYMRCLRAYKPAPDTLRIKNLWKRAKNRYYYSRKTEDTFNQLKACVKKYNKPTKYVLIPYVNVKNQEIINLTSTYLDIKERVFEDHKFMTVSNSAQWLENVYGKKKMDRMRNKPINQSLLEGPEIMRRVQLIELEMLKEVDRICRKHNIKYSLFAGTLLGAVRHKGFVPWDDDVDVCMLYEDYKRFIEIASKELDSEKYFLRTQETDVDCNLTFLQIKRNGTLFLRKGRSKFNTHNGVFIDVLPLFNGSKSTILHKIQYKLCMFLKTIIWSHLGAQSELHTIKRWYYTQLSRISNKKCYSLFLKIATLVKEESDYLLYVSARRSPICRAYTKRSNYDDLIEWEFEGHMFFIPKNYDEILRYSYSDDYMRYPNLSKRVARHLPSVIDIGNLYEY